MNPEAMPYGSQVIEITLQEKLAEIDANIAELQNQIEFGDALKRLESNPDFKLVIINGYLGAEAARITNLIVGDDPLRRETMENIVEAGLSIRNLKQFIKYKKIDAIQAPNNIDENIAYRKQVTAEYAEDGSYIDATEE